MGIFDVFSDSNEQEAARLKAAGLKQGFEQSVPLLQQGYNTSINYLDRAGAPFTDLLNMGKSNYGRFSDLYADASGANGADGIKRAGELYKLMPGYSAGQSTGLDLLERRAAARGDLAGGNTSADTIKFASDYDAGKYKDFLSQLVPGLSSGQSLLTSGASGSAGILGKEADLSTDLYKNLGKLSYDTNTGEANAFADAELAKDKTSSNFWNALIGGASLATKAFNPISSFTGAGGASFAGNPWSLAGNASVPRAGLDF